jgi:hypothetical protein
MEAEMKNLLPTLTTVVSILALGCGGAQTAPEASPEPDPGESTAIATDPEPAAEPPDVAIAPIGVGETIEVEYEFGAWGPCHKQRIVYSKNADVYTYARHCDDDGSMTAEGITAEQFRQAVYIEDHLPAAGRTMAELPAESFPERCPDCTKCFRSPDEVLTTCQNSSGVVSYMFSNPAALGKTDANTTRLLISYDEQ